MTAVVRYTEAGHDPLWTVQGADETLTAFVARVPGGDPEPATSGCDFEDEWTTDTGAVTVHVCKKCGDASQATCEAQFNQLVALLKGEYPPDP